MRSFSVLIPLFAAGAAASHLGATSENWRDYTWSYEPEQTANYYKDHGFKPPSVATDITPVELQKSYIVKMECLGCPFRVRELGQTYEPWAKEPVDNSLLLNFTVDSHVLLLNGKRIAPLAPLPLKLWAYQTPTNLSAPIMGKIIEMKMLDESWKVGTKYGMFELSYSHTRMLEDRYTEILQFDVIYVDISSGSNPGGKELDRPGQKVVQMRLSRKNYGEGLKIKTIELVDRDDIIKDTKFKRPCGKDTSIQTVFRSTEWDYYGHKGTWERTFNLVSWTIGEWLSDHILLFILAGICFAGYFLVLLRARYQQRAMRRGEEDTEAALLEEAEEDAEIVLLEEAEEKDLLVLEERIE
ncbi:hypothetical protein AOQ84DRAFT_439508 [Glonium stellatum]|uniref:Uncharacterized protein n=1 Tax=Glonium stellatum TaxID=574774 RepID=A0A8E2JT61_9PEZI|nr:hypothetical protein AOQ84DRAFT_439508 [Glonium stellatum]